MKDFVKEMYWRFVVWNAFKGISLTYYEKLQEDVDKHGFCYEIPMDYNWFQRIVRRIRKLPTNRRRLDPGELSSWVYIKEKLKEEEDYEEKRRL
jgi:hypothetical protein